jgi:N-acyl-D-aspartate/D-glutamate deacylase
LLCITIATTFLWLNSTAQAQSYDIVIVGGRVVDPETGLDGIRNIGIRNGTIAAISKSPLAGSARFDAHGLIVAPGFIDLHQHGQSDDDYRLKAFDGVTTALEMEIGTPDVSGFLAARRNRALINYGTTADYDAARALAFQVPLPSGQNLPRSGPATNLPATSEQVAATEAELKKQIGAGALGIGMGIEYVPGASYAEILSIFQLAAAENLPVYTHVRSSGRNDPGSSVSSVGEVIADAAITGAPVHIAHISSTCLKQTPTAGMTQINSALFNPGWQEKLGISFGDLALPDTGERLTAPRFDELHADPNPHLVLLYKNDDATVDHTVLSPLVMIASDGEKGHPREAGSFCRILARYVREQKSLSLMEAVRKMTLMPAQVLEDSTSAARRKGRIRVGADADIVVFDIGRVSDEATYSHPDLPSKGMRFVLVRGTPIIVDGHLRPDILPGQALVGKHQMAKVTDR